MSLQESEFDKKKPPAQDASTGQCRRCHQMRPVDDDGFCDICRKALEEACL